MKAVLMSIQPKWCELIANGKKTVEVRKTKPKLETPFKVYIYCTANKQGTHDLLEIHGTDGKIRKANGKVIGEFVCDYIGYVRNYGDMVDSYDCKASCLSANEIIEYAKDKNGNFIYTYGWHISSIVIYDEPRELSEFKKHNRTCYYDHLGLAIPKCKECKGCQLTKPPQSWCYVESKE